MTWRASNALNLASRGLGLQTGQYTSKAKRRLSEASYLADGQIPPIDLQATQRVFCSILDELPLGVIGSSQNFERGLDGPQEGQEALRIGRSFGLYGLGCGLSHGSSGPAELLALKIALVGHS
jgi:hypothetical protein